jgi:hypothetical protein
MSETTASTSERTMPPAGPATLEAPVRRVRRIGYAVLGIQFAGLLIWSTILYHRFALTFDFSIYHQAWFLIAHGNFDPYDTVSRLQFWRNDSEFALWFLAPLYWVWPHDVLLLWLQDLGIVGAEAIAFGWLCELAQRYRPGKDAAWLAGTGLALFVANPWIWWAASFDYHEESIAIPFAVLLARDLAHGRRRAWAWVAPLLACGAPTATYVAGLGLGAVLASRRSRVPGALMVGVGVGYSLLIVLVHGDKGVPIAHIYGYLAVGAAGGAHVKLTFGELVKGVAVHPFGVVKTLWAKRADLWASAAPAGVLGVCFAAAAPLTALVLATNALVPGFRFAEPIFQYLPVYVLVPVGTVAVLGWGARRHRRAALLLSCLLVVQTLGWAVVWGPRTAGQWLRVPGSSAATLAGIEARIPASAEVIASQGVIGRFSSRVNVRSLTSGQIPLADGETWFIIAPMIGIEIQSPASAMAFIGDLAGPLHATLVSHANGVWAFRWDAPLGAHTVTVPGNSSPLPAWASPGAAGRSVTTGSPAAWHVTSTGGQGYVADELEWQEPTGRYEAYVALSATGPVNVEVWNDTGNTLLARRIITATTGVQTIALGVDVATPYRASTYSGWGPFRAVFVPPPSGQRLEVRVWSPGSGQVNVYRAALARVKGPARP